MDVDIEGAVLEQNASRLVQANVSFFAGLTSGCAGILVGQPFDTVKVRIQTAPPRAYHNAWHCCKITVQKEGISALFKGAIPPLMSAPFINALTFAAYSETSQLFFLDPRILSQTKGQIKFCAYSFEKNSFDYRKSEYGTFQEKKDVSLKSEKNRMKLSAWEAFVAGSVAGACQTVIVLPSDNIKTKLQVQVGSISSKELQFKGPIDCARKIIATQGLGALTAGGVATLWRELPAYGVYFSMYESLKEVLECRGVGPGMASFTSGGVAGCCSWLCVAPMDVIKSRQQAMQDGRSIAARSIIACSKMMYLEGGLRVFVKGLGTTLIRAFPVNAVIFPVYEWTVRLFQSSG